MLVCGKLDKIMKTTMKNLELKNRMLIASENQSLDSLYEKQVDENLYTDNCDYEKDPTGLFFSLDNDEFYFVDYVTNHSGWKNAHEQQNNCVFLTYVNASTAIMSSLETLIEEHEYEA